MDEITISLDDSPLISQPSPVLIGDQIPVNVQENFVGGRSATIQIGSIETLPAGSEAYVQNVGTETDAVFNFGIPEGERGLSGSDGEDGADGQAATITVGTVTTGLPESNATVTNVGTSSAAILDFSIPRGSQGERGLQGVAGEDGVSPIAYVTQTSTGATIHIEDAQNVTDAVITNGTDGTDGTDGFSPVATVTQNTGSATISITDSQGTTTATVYDGTDGTDGTDGQAATITVGSTTTGAVGTNASVVNSGTSSAAVLDFTIPRGQDGSIEELTSVPKFNAYYNTTYSSFPADTPIPYNTTAVNIGSFSMTGGRIIIPKTGNYMITVQLWVQNGGSRSWWRLRRNTNTIGESIISGTSYWGLTAISNIYPCTQGDIIDVIKTGSESVNLNSGSADKRTTSISIQYIG